MKNRFFIHVILIFVIFLHSCSVSLIEKRRYRSGYYWRGGNDVVLVQKHKREQLKITSTENNLTTDSIASVFYSTQDMSLKNFVFCGVNNSADTKHEQNYLQNNESESIGLVSPELKKGSLKNISSKNNSKGWLLLLGLFGLSTATLVWQKKHLAKLSGWANQNKMISRGLIVALHVILAGVSYLSGGLMKDLHINTPENTNAALLSIGAVALAMYPTKNKNYLRRKFFDLILLLSGAGIIMNITNTSTELFPVKSHQAEIGFSNNNETKAKDVSEMSTDEKVLALIFLFAVAIALCYLIGALGCGLWCSGVEILGMIIMIGGPIGIFALYVWGARRILYGKQPDNKSKFKWHHFYFILSMLLLLGLFFFASDVSGLTLVFLIPAIILFFLSIFKK